MPSNTLTCTRTVSELNGGGGKTVWADGDALFSLGLAVLLSPASLEVRRTQRWTTGRVLARIPGRGTVQTELLRLLLRRKGSW